ncbi:MAG: hypothetical protein AB8B84_09435 [Granulosicoccus sp.]
MPVSAAIINKNYLLWTKERVALPDWPDRDPLVLSNGYASIIYLDNGFQFKFLATKSKLLFKLICVGVLTVNGLVLHHVSFPLLVREGVALNPLNTVLLVVSGGLSTSHWLLAAFVGLAKPLGRLPLDVLLSLYSLFLGAVLISSVLSLPLVNRMQLIKKQQPAF